MKKSPAKVPATKSNELIEAIDRNFTSPNVLDKNLEPANIVDGLYAIAEAINRLAEAVAKSQGK